MTALPAFEHAVVRRSRFAASAGAFEWIDARTLADTTDAARHRQAALDHMSGPWAAANPAARVVRVEVREVPAQQISTPQEDLTMTNGSHAPAQLTRSTFTLADIAAVTRRWPTGKTEKFTAGDLARLLDFAVSAGSVNSAVDNGHVNLCLRGLGNLLFAAHGDSDEAADSAAVKDYTARGFFLERTLEDLATRLETPDEGRPEEWEITLVPACSQEREPDPDSRRAR